MPKRNRETFELSYWLQKPSISQRPRALQTLRGTLLVKLLNACSTLLLARMGPMTRTRKRKDDEF